MVCEIEHDANRLFLYINVAHIAADQANRDDSQERSAQEYNERRDAKTRQHVPSLGYFLRGTR